MQFELSVQQTLILSQNSFQICRTKRWRKFYQNDVDNHELLQRRTETCLQFDPFAEFKYHCVSSITTSITLSHLQISPAWSNKSIMDNKNK